MMKQKDRDMLIEMHNDVKWIMKSLQGNGSKGLIEQVRSNTNWKYYCMGGFAVIIGLIGIAIKLI